MSAATSLSRGSARAPPATGTSASPRARAEQLVDTLAALIGEWDEEDEGAEGIGDFVVNLNAFPRPGTVVTEGAER